MTPPLDLQRALSELIGDAQLVPCPLPGTALSLWLLDTDNMDRAFSPEETRRILHEPPYWSFCWASGLALARYLAANPEWVAANACWILAPVPAWPGSPRQGGCAGSGRV